MTRGGLLDWSQINLEDTVRVILRAEGREPTLAEMKAWATLFIQRFAPWWRPTQPLPWRTAEQVGAALMRLAAQARREKDPLGWVTRL